MDDEYSGRAEMKEEHEESQSLIDDTEVEKVSIVHETLVSSKEKWLSMQNNDNVGGNVLSTGPRNSQHIDGSCGVIRDDVERNDFQEDADVELSHVGETTKNGGDHSEKDNELGVFGGMFEEGGTSKIGDVGREKSNQKKKNKNGQVQKKEK